MLQPELHAAVLRLRRDLLRSRLGWVHGLHQALQDAIRQLLDRPKRNLDGSWGLGLGISCGERW